MADDDANAVAPFRHRHDGWTRDRQKRFLERLTETGCVSEACGGRRTATERCVTSEEIDRSLNKRLDALARRLGQDRQAIGLANEKAAEEARRGGASSLNLPSVRVCTDATAVPKIDVDS